MAVSQRDQYLRYRSLCESMKRAVDAVSSHIHRAGSACSEVSPSQFAALEALYSRGPLHQGELACAISRSSGNMTVIVDNLERRGLVTRCGVHGDRRVVQICLTEKGAHLIELLLPEHRSRLIDVFSGLDEADFARCDALLREIAARIGGSDAES
ncbi:MAG: HTH-type transcriptional regulator MhqR [Calditrichaeota bacterium]|nr:HTH-type transcriptional regulator MhqR [Calditrichota bacterium]